MSTPHLLFTKSLSEHRRKLLEQKVQVTEVMALDPVMLPLIEAPEQREWAIVSSPHALESIRELLENGWGREMKWACVGFRSRDVLTDLGIDAVIKADNAAELVQRLPSEGSALFLCGKDRTPTIENYMNENNWDLHLIETYWTQATHPHVDFTKYDAVVFFSPRNVDSMLRHNDWPENGVAIAIGPTTARALRERNIEPAIVPDKPDVLLLTQLYLENSNYGSSK